MNLEDAIKAARETGEPQTVSEPFPGTGLVDDYTDPSGKIGPTPLDENPIVQAAREHARRQAAGDDPLPT